MGLAGVGGRLGPGCLGGFWERVFDYFLSMLKHDIHIKPKSYKLELLGELVI